MKSHALWVKTSDLIGISYIKVRVRWFISRATAYGCFGGWYDGPSYSLGSSALSTELLGDFQQGSFSYRRDFSAVVIELYQDNTLYYLSVTEDGLSLTPETALESFLLSREW